MGHWDNREPCRVEMFATSLLAAESERAREQVLLDAIKTFGYDTYFFGGIPVQDASEVSNLILLSNCDAAFLKEHNDNKSYRNDTLAIHCLTNKTPFLWSALDTHEFEKPEQQFTTQRAQQAGYRVGVTLPLWTPQRFYPFGISFSKRDDDDFAGHDRQFQKFHGALTAIAYLYFGQLDMTSMLQQNYKLTQDELVVLAHSAHRDDKQTVIAHELEMTDYEFKQHLREIRTKMGVRNTRTAQLRYVLFGGKLVKRNLGHSKNSSGSS